MQLCEVLETKVILLHCRGRGDGGGITATCLTDQYNGMLLQVIAVVTSADEATLLTKSYPSLSMFAVGGNLTFLTSHFFSHSPPPPPPPHSQDHGSLQLQKSCDFVPAGDWGLRG